LSREHRRKESSLSFLSEKRSRLQRHDRWSESGTCPAVGVYSTGGR
jgi:hypothetical protein